MLKFIKEKFLPKKIPRKVTFATSCYEKDYKVILEDETYLKKRLIDPNSYNFSEKIIIINNVDDEKRAEAAAEKLVKKGVIDKFYLASTLEKEMLFFFKLKRSDFKAIEKRFSDEDVFFNSRAFLTSIYVAQGDYLLHNTEDTYLKKKINWIDKAIDMMQMHDDYKVANLVWNERIDEVKKESFKKEKDFYIADASFSDQQFLVNLDDFKKPIYSEIIDDSSHYPWGGIFEKRVFSFMKNQGWKRIIFESGSYSHKSF